MSSRTPATTYILIIVSMLLWGMSFIWTSIVFRCYPPITTIFLRLVLSSAFLLGGLLLFKKLERIKREDYRLFVVSSLFNPFLYFIGENFGLKYSSPSISAVVIATIPLFTPVAARIMLKERLSGMNIAGIFLSFSGILVMLVNRDMSLNAAPTGILLLMFAVASAVIYSIFLKRLTDRYGAFSIIAWQNLAGALYFLPLFLVFDLRRFLTIEPDFATVSALVQLSFFASSVAYILFTVGVKKIGVSRTNVFSNLIPIFTAIFSYFILSEHFTANKIAGIIIVITGVLLAQMKKINSD